MRTCSIILENHRGELLFSNKGLSHANMLNNSGDPMRGMVLWEMCLSHANMLNNSGGLAISSFCDLISLSHANMLNNSGDLPRTWFACRKIV